MPKTVSARIENHTHDDLIDRCNKVGCRVSDFVKASIEFSLYGEVEFDFGMEEDKEDSSSIEKQEPKPTYTPRIHYMEPPNNVGNTLLKMHSK